ncbi:MAG TPA: AMP-binding protein [Myxococcaceae bacterium]
MLPHILRERARQTPGRVAFTFPDPVTYAELDARAGAIARALAEIAEPGQRAMLLYPPGPEYVAGFFGCLAAGLVAVPVFPPGSLGGRQAGRLRAIARDAAPRAALVSAEHGALAADLFDRAPVRVLDTSRLEPMPSGPEPRCSPDGVAFLQYTSGSTGDPRGVVVTHDNLLRNSRLIQESFGHTPEDVGVIWLPPYHDMGLIGGVLQPIFTGFPVHLMSPLSFVRHPLRWLEALSRHGGTISGGPNFAYEACLRAVTPEQRDRLDLSRWRVAFTGAEPVRAATLERFADFFAPCGFRREALRPVYGLAEATLMVTCGALGRAPSVRSFGAAGLERGRAEPGTGGEPSRAMVSCGRAREERLAVVDPESRRERTPGEVGEIWVSGASVARGYWERPEASAACFGARLDGARDPADAARDFLRTGDLGFVLDGELFITGRLKDLVILQGRNLYPQDIEEAVAQAHPAIVPGGCAAFSVDDDEEKLVVLAEVETRGGKAAGDLGEVSDRILRAVAAAFEVTPAVVALVRARSLPRTSSGKLRRGACRDAFLGGALEMVAERRATAPVVSPRTATEALLAALAARVLGVDSLGLHDSFLAHGGDSVRAAQLAAQAVELGLQLSPRQLLEHPTVASVAQVVEGAAELDRRADGEALVLSPWQARRLAASAAAPPVERSVELDPSLDPSIVDGAVEAVRSAHEALRRASPMGAIQFAREPDRLRVSAHPLLLDGESWRIVLRDLELAIDQRRQGRPIALSPGAPYLAWTARLARAVDPTKREAPPASPEILSLRVEGEAATRALRLEPARVEALRLRARSAGIRLQALLLAAAGRALGRALGHPVLSAWLECNARQGLLETLDLSGLVGNLDLELPLRLSAAPAESLESAARQVALAQVEALRADAWRTPPELPPAFLRFSMREERPPGPRAPAAVGLDAVERDGGLLLTWEDRRAAGSLSMEALETAFLEELAGEAHPVAKPELQASAGVSPEQLSRALAQLGKKRRTEER